VLGEHGDREVAAFSTVTIGGLNLECFAEAGRVPGREALVEGAFTHQASGH